MQVLRAVLLLDRYLQALLVAGARAGTNRLLFLLSFTFFRLPLEYSRHSFQIFGMLQLFVSGAFS